MKKSNFWNEVDIRGERADKEFRKDIKVSCLLLLATPFVIILTCFIPYIMIPIIVIVLLKVYKKRP